MAGIGRKDPEETNPAHTLIMDQGEIHDLAYRTVRKRNLYCFSCPVYGALLRQPEQTNTVWKVGARAARTT